MQQRGTFVAMTIPPATASAEGRLIKGGPFPATASAEGAQLNVPPSLWERELTSALCITERMSHYYA